MFLGSCVYCVHLCTSVSYNMTFHMQVIHDFATYWWDLIKIYPLRAIFLLQLSLGKTYIALFCPHTMSERIFPSWSTWSMMPSSRCKNWGPRVMTVLCLLIINCAYPQKSTLWGGYRRGQLPGRHPRGRAAAPGRHRRYKLEASILDINSISPYRLSLSTSCSSVLTRLSFTAGPARWVSAAPTSTA